MLRVEILLTFDHSITNLQELTEKSKEIKQYLLNESEIVQVEVSLSLSDGSDIDGFQLVEKMRNSKLSISK
jgi:hypothetical protein